jgi:tetratricopeptide (TPR) repeat protein
VRALIALACLLCLCVPRGTAHATPSQDLAKARELFRAGNYEEARRFFSDLLYPYPRLANASDLADAHIGLGVALFETGNAKRAAEEFERALRFDPNYQLDPLVITNKKAIELFDDTKAEIRLRSEREEARKREAAERERLRLFRESIIFVRENSLVLNFIPGGGQFQNGQPVKAALFLGGQVITAGTSVGIWYHLVNRYGIRSDRVPLEDGPRVRRLQQIEIGAGVAFFALYAWGVIDALRHYQPTVRTQFDESQLPEEYRDNGGDKKPPAQPKTSLLERIQISPMLSPSGAGIGIGWEIN